MHCALPAFLRRPPADRKGIAALEFAIIGTVMALTLAALVDLGDVAQQRVQLQQAVRAGAQYALANPGDTAGMVSAIKSALPTSWQASATIPTPATSCQCWDSASGSSACGSGNTCAAGLTTELFVTLSVSMPYTPLMSGILTNSASMIVRYE